MLLHGKNVLIINNSSGLVTKGKKQKGQTCYAYAATNVLETCYLKATTSNKLSKPDPYKPETILEFQDGLDLADKFALKCRHLAGTGGPNLGMPWRNIGFVKRLSGMSPSQEEWMNKYKENCVWAVNNVTQWSTMGEHGAHVVKYGTGVCSTFDKIKYFVYKYGALAVITK